MRHTLISEWTRNATYCNFRDKHENEQQHFQVSNWSKLLFNFFFLIASHFYFCFLTKLQLLATTAFLKIKLQYVAFLVHSEIKVWLMQVLLNYFPDSLLFLFLFPPSISTFGNDGFLKMELQLFAWLVHTEIEINEVHFIILNINNF